MSSVVKRLADFGPFTLDFSQHRLFRGRDPIDLPPRAVAILEYLIEHRERCVSKDELRQQFWPGVRVVADNNIERQISKIRSALDDSAKHPQYVETRYTLGWQFIASVAERTQVDVLGEADASSAPAGTIPVPVDIPQAIQSSQDPATPIASPESPQTGVNRFSQAAFSLMLLAVAGAGLAVWRTPRQEPKVTNLRQLTDDGKPKLGPLLTDGRHIFFVETMGASDQAVSVAISGGEPLRLNLPLSNVELKDISRDGSTLLVRSNDPSGPKLWSYSISAKSLHPLGTGLTEAAWSPDGSALAASDVNGYSLQIFRGAITHKTDLPGHLERFRWAPDGKRLRICLRDPRQESWSEWEITEGNGRLRRLASISDGQPMILSGSWSPDGKYFFYEAGTHWHRDIWVSRDSTGSFIPDTSKPWRLTTPEPGSWRWPTASLDPSKDNTTLFALNDFVRSELVRFDRNTDSWQPEWQGAAAFEVDYSRDSKWAVYTSLRDHTIWKARPDGTERAQLTAMGVEAHQPHWSPDGTRIAFMGKNASGQWRIFQMLSNGGALEELLPNGADQGVPTWSADGRSVIFGERLSARPRVEMAIHMLDLKTRRLSDMEGTKGLWSPRWSPNGRYVAAITSDSQAIRIVPWPSTQWSELVRMRFVDNATWSTDSRYIHFNGVDEGNRRWLFRVGVPNGRSERIANLADFTAASENWFGVALDGVPLAFRGVRIQEIYSLKCELP